MTQTPSRLATAYAHCEKLARDHYENFPVASLLLPRRMRRHVAAIYAFARTADDFADEPGHEGNRLELLDDWRRQLDGAARGEAEGPIFTALSDTLSKHDLPLQLFHDLISAFEQDVRVRSYATFNDVLAYCRLSANPVGRLVLHLFGYRDDHLMIQSDAICTGLQLANFWQDVSIDLDKGRCYLPHEDMQRFGCDPDTLSRRVASTPFADLLRFQVERTRDIFSEGSRLPRRIGGRLGFELRLVLYGGLCVLERIEAVDYDVFTRRPSLSAGDWGRLMMKATFRRGGLPIAAVPRQTP